MFGRYMFDHFTFNNARSSVALCRAGVCPDREPLVRALPHPAGRAGPVGQDGKTIGIGVTRSTGVGKLVPRDILVEPEASVVDEAPAGAFRQLLRPKQIINDKEDVTTTPPGLLHCRQGDTRPLPSARRPVHRMHGFQIFHSFGSGFESLLLEPMLVYSGNTTELEFTFYSVSHVSTVVVAPYNSVLVTQATIEDSDCALMVDTEAPLDLCGRHS
jgi:hypothetical protein